ncbi:MAG: carbamoyltransferase HypF [Caldilineales bacterium]|nr:carbamoyltransferase HypF [Caldilineales bacterium]
MSSDAAGLAIQRLRVVVRGAVQGVGFRPFVYRLATGLGLTGWVINNSQGVFVEVEGEAETLQTFLARLTAEKPPRALIQEVESAWLPAVGFTAFEIRHSEAEGNKTVLVLPDVATCADCLAEVLDPGDRRYRYPFTNCTNCGPRFTIIQALPYDRPNTTMRRFTMCPACRREYDDPLDRRFHAQPNACPVCGPQLALHGADGELLAEGDAALQLAAEAIRAGLIVAVKGLGGFHLVVDAANAEAIQRLRQRKPRRDKPFALMAVDLAHVRQLCEVSPQAEALLTSPEAPIVLMPRRPDAAVAENVAPGNPTLGVMLPYTPLHHLLLRELSLPSAGQGQATARPVPAVVATSGNLTDEPIYTDEQEAMQRLGHIAERFLVHNRPIERHADDSVAWVVDGEPRLLRRARGYAPLPVLLKEPVPTILAVGAHLKNTVALSVGRQVFISQHIGDLETAEAMAAFERVIADFLRLYEAEPVAIAHDLHPDYLSTQWAKEMGEQRETRVRREIGQPRDPAETAKRVEHCAPFSSFPSPFPSFPSSPHLIPVQHHHAHLAACLAEHGVEGPALGVTWDGTGYGPDGTVWGGEFLLGDAADYARVARLRPFRLPGGDAAIKEPRRVAFAMLWALYGDQVAEWEHLAPVRSLAAGERRLLAQMLRRGLNAPWTTSAGRLFDGVAALIGLHQQVSFEGQAAMALEFAADAGDHGAYPVELVEELGGTQGSSAASTSSSSSSPSSPPSLTSPTPLLLDWQPTVEALLCDLRAGVSWGIIAARFHAALVEVILQVAERVGQPRVALTGGCFQNRRLTEDAARRLRQAGFQVLLHRQVPPNDGGISLGQVAVAAARLQRWQ